MTNSTTYNNYIAGEWVAGTETIENRNPSEPSDLIGLYAQADEKQLHAALAAAKAAQEKWADVGLEKRQSVLAAIGKEMIERSAELGEQLSREEGKPLAEGIGEVYRAGQFFNYFAAETLRQLGDTAASVRPGVEIDVHREPLGTVAVISPWNFPTATASWKIAPALAFGNAVLWKPANLTPASAVLLTEIIARQDIPAGLFNLLMGAGDSLGQQLAATAAIDGISFTGSLAVGRKIAATATPNLTKLQMEMGSKNPLVVMDDADLDVAANSAAVGAYGGSGQKCTASSRLIVHEAVFDAFVEKMTDGGNGGYEGRSRIRRRNENWPGGQRFAIGINQSYIRLAKEEGAQHVLAVRYCPAKDILCRRRFLSATMICALIARNVCADCPA